MARYPMVDRPKLDAIEEKYGMNIRQVVAMLYLRYGNLTGVSYELEVSRQILYRWIGKHEIAMLKAQAGMQRGNVTEVSAGVNVR